ncbi:fimbria/pilus outer membrane usher protein [Sphingopyxis sp. MWB1]|uniref:fimbria/pilus outer membrane usher protein n=1 Tax=Sphingopyxis sp. MWB1 TaxID=1537715 RepID=UPI00068DB5E5|nr:fimbria/pilus outer membrane usher protein [Sphingopyxis sp. MWB1]
MLLTSGISVSAQAGAAEGDAHAQVDFDAEMLRGRGIDPKLAEYFRDAPKFSSGSRMVTLILNGVKRGNVEARFDKDGQLCFDGNFLSEAGLRRPGSDFILNPEAPEAERCFAFLTAYPQTSLTLRPNRDEVVLVVPQNALGDDAHQIEAYSRGGSAGVMNYDVVAQRSTTSGLTRNYISASSQIGFNIADWVVRSRQIYTNDNGRDRFEHLYAYAQRTFPERKLTAQIGQINIANPLLAGAPIYGVQLTPETSLLEQAGAGVLVEGVAQTQATVHIRQAGVLIYTTMVPEGPFKLTDIPLLNTSSDLSVTIRETDGSERSFVVPAASFRTAALAPAGYSFALGKVREISGDESALPWVATGAGTWRLDEGTMLTAAAAVANNYKAAGWGLDTSLGRDTVVSMRNIFSTTDSDRGTRFSIAANTRLAENLSLSLSGTRQTIGYRDLSDTIIPDDGDHWNQRFKNQLTASVTWAHSSLGSFNLAYSSNRTFSGQWVDRLTGSWSTMIDRATLSANVETTIGGSSEEYRGGNAFLLNLSIPFGPRRVRAYASQRGGTSRVGASMSERVNDHLAYRVAAEHNSGTGDLYLSGNLSATTRIADADISYSQNGSSRSYGARLRGSVVAHKDGATLSPYPVDDTFGIVKVGDISGVKVATPYGPVWTDGEGEAVIPQLKSYKTSRIEIATKTLPRQIDIKNGVKMIDAGRGSVNMVGFDVIETNRVLVHAVDAKGVPLEKGSSVFGPDNGFLTTVLDDGAIFLVGNKSPSTLKVTRPDGRSCNLTVILKSEGDENALYDTAEGMCDV